MAPWLELGADDTPEKQSRKEYIELAVKGISNAVNPSLPDRLIFGGPPQPLASAAFLIEKLLRTPKQLWDNLSVPVRKRVVTELRRSHAVKPDESDWLLLTSIIEATLQKFTGGCDTIRPNYGVHKFRDLWYKGDAQCDDGVNSRLGYYNSFVVHPILADILIVTQKHRIPGAESLKVQQKRLEHYAEQLEQFTSSKGTYPVIRRSIVYRTRVFHALGQAALLYLLPEHTAPAQVCCVMTKVIEDRFRSTDDFDINDWLRIGFSGSQARISESYIGTGSAYLCLAGFLPLRLSADDAFWSAPSVR